MSDGRGRPRTPIGGVGNISINPAVTGFTAETYTRTASGQRKRIQAKGSSPKEATAALVAKAAKLGAASTGVANVSTLRELLDLWLTDMIEPRLVLPQTKRMYASKANELGDMFGAIELVDLRGGRLQVMLNRLAAQVTVNEYPVLRGVLDQALNYGVLVEVLVANYLSVTTKPPLQPKAVPLSLTVEQLQVFREEFRLYVQEGKRESNRGRAMLLVDVILGCGGLRIAEALALRHRDVDVAASTVDITGTVVYTPGNGVSRQNKLKRERQKRGLTLASDSMAMEALRAAIALSPPDRRRPDDPVFARVERDISPWMNPEIPSEHFDAVTWRPAVVESLAQTEMRPEQLSPKTLRSTVATLVARGEGEERAQEVLAHGEVKTTKQSYITPEGKTVHLETLDALLSI
ncbi:site-specific integrase [Microbacterium sp. Cr-K29]|uniref:site-specific integrase n=1 Tax=Microbacterium sp. Cr-K29 TaxID=1452534 RepID=UPI00049317FB|nr:tyrosine-type recombinase/integrase [Microbacterium sp. Cr-K29]